MGFEIKRFQSDVDEEFICPICSGVLENPLQAPACEHAFCRACITEWISRQPTCPVDQQVVTASQLRPVPRIILNVLSRGEFNPKKPIPCEAGCELVIPKDELAEHNCVRELRTLMATQLNDYKQELEEHKRELALLKEFMRDQKERQEVVRWANSLPRVNHVDDWPAMWTAHEEDPYVIKGILSESGCPPHIIDNLTENCHELRWPPDVENHVYNIENKSRFYESYVCRRVPGKQLVLFLHCDNMFMDKRAMVEPGFVVFFEDGIKIE